MVKSTTISMDEDLKRGTVETPDSPGLSFNAYATMASRQLFTQRRVPFSTVAPERVIVISDDVAQEPGRMRIRRSGIGTVHDG